MGLLNTEQTAMQHRGHGTCWLPCAALRIASVGQEIIWIIFEACDDAVSPLPGNTIDILEPQNCRFVAREQTGRANAEATDQIRHAVVIPVDLQNAAPFEAVFSASFAEPQGGLVHLSDGLEARGGKDGNRNGSEGAWKHPFVLPQWSDIDWRRVAIYLRDARLLA